MTREEAIKLAEQAGWKGPKEYTEAEVRLIIEGAIAEEREACAKMAEQIEKDRFDAVGDPRIKEFKSKIAEAIRARGQG